jgi:AmmeMemoRadiSam system protein B
MFRRPMAFAGSWYPDTVEGCLEQMRRWEQAAAPSATPRQKPADAPPPARFCVSPHAGWMYSGRLAARAVQAMTAGAASADPVRLVVLLGGHLHRDDPIITMSEGEWETPFGVFPIHAGFDRFLDGLPEVVRETQQRSEPDNSIEVLLPIAKRAFPGAELLPIRVPPSEVALELGARLARHLAAEGLAAVAIASTDLTHYGPNYGFEPRGRGPDAERWVREENDPLFLKAIERGSGRDILDTARRQRNACCPGAVAALNEIVRAQGGPPAFHALDYATSLDAARELSPGERESRNFVGYLAGVYA